MEWKALFISENSNSMGNVHNHKRILTYPEKAGSLLQFSLEHMPCYYLENYMRKTEIIHSTEV